MRYGSSNKKKTWELYYTSTVSNNSQKENQFNEQIKLRTRKIMFDLCLSLSNHHPEDNNNNNNNNNNNYLLITIKLITIN